MTTPRPRFSPGDLRRATPKPAGSTAPPAPPLIAPTGSASLDALASVVNATASPFQNAPPAEQGTLGVISNGVNAVLGIVGAPFQLLDTGLAMLTAGVASLFPALPAATMAAPHLAPPHAHSHPPSLIPPAPPVPLPSIGVVMAACSVTTLVCGLPAARAGDVGLAPTCGSLSPAFEVYTGSSQVFIGGSRAARILDITRHCNPASLMSSFGKVMGGIGVAAGALGAGAAAAGGNAAQAAGMAAQAAADAGALALSTLLGKDPGIPPGIGALMFGAPTVLIGGFPMPDSLEAIMGLAKLAKTLGKGLRGGRRAGRLFCLNCG